MRTIYLTLILLSCFIRPMYGQDIKQSKLDLMQGVWENTMNSNSEFAYSIIHGVKSLDFVYSTDDKKLDFPLSESLVGFQNSDNGNRDSINMNDLKKDGMYYTILDCKYIDDKGWIHRPDYLTPEYFECDGEVMSVNGGQLVEYEKLKRLPSNALKKLYDRGEVDKCNYIKEYLNIEVKEIKVNKSYIYSRPDALTKMYFIKGDVVTVVGKSGDWLHIEYLGKRLIQGWIHNKDVK